MALKTVDRVPVTFLCDPETLERIKGKAQTEHRTLSAMLRLIVDEATRPATPEN